MHLVAWPEREQLIEIEERLKGLFAVFVLLGLHYMGMVRAGSRGRPGRIFCRSVAGVSSAPLLRSSRLTEL